MKRQLKRIGVVLALLVLGGGVALFLLPRDRITADSWTQIRLGMSMKVHYLSCSGVGRPS